MDCMGILVLGGRCVVGVVGDGIGAFVAVPDGIVGDGANPTI